MARQAGLSDGQFLDDGRLSDLRRAAAVQDAMDRALHYLSYRARSRAEVERDLRGRGYDPEVISTVVRRCEQLDYLGDRTFAAAYVRDRVRLKPRGRSRLLAELRRKGVSAEDARAGLEAALAELEVSEGDLLERAARKKWRTLGEVDRPTARRRLFGYLARRGFRSSDVREIVGRLLEEEDPA